MKCAVCGQEFGNGEICQQCGVDRVAGLGNYDGFHTGQILSKTKVISQEPKITTQNSICWNCGEIIPSNAKYCPFCETALYVDCPKCGYNHESRFPSCPNCGTNREAYLKEKEELAERERIEKEERRKELQTLLNQNTDYIVKLQKRWRIYILVDLIFWTIVLALGIIFAVLVVAPLVLISSFALINTIMAACFLIDIYNTGSIGEFEGLIYENIKEKVRKKINWMESDYSYSTFAEEFETVYENCKKSHRS